MTQKPPVRSIPPHVQDLLSALRLRIRLYVWLQGIAVAVIWLGLMFWISYLIDYWLLVRGFAVEFPKLGRAVLLVITGGVLAFIFYRWILRRAFVRMADRSMAILLERQFDSFHDSLVTSVEMSDQPDHAREFSPDMLTHTGRDALTAIEKVRLGEVFNLWPLAISGVAAILLILSVGTFGVMSSLAAGPGETSHFQRAVNRLYLPYDSQPWDRLAKIEVVGVSTLKTPGVGAEYVPEVLRADQHGVIRVAKGSKVMLHVRARADKVLPEKCELTYAYDDGTGGGPVELAATGTVRKEVGENGKRVPYQYFTLDQHPFNGPLSSFQFEVVGVQKGALTDWPISNRVDGYIDVVSIPTLSSVQLRYTLPDYIDASQTEKNTDYRSGSKLPVGSSLTVQCQANKPLHYAHVVYPATDQAEEEVKTIDISQGQKDRRWFEFSVPSLNDDLYVEITVQDDDGLVSDSPYRVSVAAVPDDPPNVDAHLQGIGTAVTPDVIVPFAGSITDKYAVARTWIEVQATGQEPFRHAFPLDAGGRIETAIDFQAKREDKNDGYKLVPGEDNRLVVVVKAADYCDLNGNGNTGAGNIHELDIVTPDRLLVLLEKLEADQRQRLEDIYGEMQEALKFQLQVRAQGDLDSGAGFEPGDVVPGADVPGDSDVQNVDEVRLIFAQRASVQTHKSSQELIGVIATIRDIRMQMINNRLDADAHKQRLKEQIADPLQQVADERFPRLKDALLTLEDRLDHLVRSPEEETLALEVELAVDESIRQTEDLLLELGRIVENLRTIENYNLLLSKVRELYEAQVELKERTEEESEKQSLEDLLD